MHAKLVRVFFVVAILLIGAAVAACTAVQPQGGPPASTAASAEEPAAAAPATEPAAEPAAAAAAPITVLVRELPVSLDPYAVSNAGAAYMLGQLYDAPVYVGSDGQLLAGLAQAVDVAPSRMEYTFTLRPNIVFHDGTPLDAASLVAAWRRGVEAGQIHWQAAANVEALDVSTVRVTLSAPKDDFLPVDVARWPVILEKPGADGTATLVGSGPYMPARQDDGTLVLTPNPRHWAGAGAAAGEIIVQGEPDPKAAAQAVADGMANLAFDLSDADIAGLQETDNLKIIWPRFPEFAALDIVNALPAEVNLPALEALNGIAAGDPVAAVAILKALNLSGGSALQLACSTTSEAGEAACAEVVDAFTAAGIKTETVANADLGAMATLPLGLSTFYDESALANLVSFHDMDLAGAAWLGLLAQGECPNCDLINPLLWPPPPPPPKNEVLVVRR